ncbi:MAG: TonB-dependent receptor plug domain-containing protein [Balneolaceae bacterium]|jgi:hypothetical protein
MKKVKIWAKLPIVIAALILTGCASSGGTKGSSGPNKEIKNKVSSNEFLSLEDYLRRLNGVQVYGSGSNLRVRIRSNMSVSNLQEQPLYILNGQEIGRDYGRVSQLVARGQIKSVEAIPASRSSEYGARGSAGVIIIETK